jgi:hypothetical protein
LVTFNHLGLKNLTFNANPTFAIIVKNGQNLPNFDS